MTPSGTPKRVLVFSLQYHPFIGGAEVAIKEITDRMPETEFHMVTLRFDRNLPALEKLGNVVVHRIGFTKPGVTAAGLRRFPLHLNKHWYQLAAAFHAATLHRTLRFDGIWAMMAHATGIPAGLFKTFHPRVPYLLTLQEGDPPEHIERLARPVWPLFTRAFTTADAVQAISSFLGAWAKKRGAHRIEVIPNGVDAKRFARAFTADERARTAAAYGKKEGETWLVTTSRLVHKNAVDTVIRAVPQMPPEVAFVIAGIGPEEEALRTLADGLGVSERVRFLGEVSQAELPALLSACDLFTRPSRSEGMGISFIEAMAAGLPVIATRVGGIPDFLTEGETGWTVDVDAPQQIADAARRIMGDPARTSGIIGRAKAMALRDYDWDLVAKRMRALMTDCFASRAPAASPS